MERVYLARKTFNLANSWRCLGFYSSDDDTPSALKSSALIIQSVGIEPSIRVQARERRSSVKTSDICELPFTMRTSLVAAILIPFAVHISDAEPGHSFVSFLSDYIKFYNVGGVYLDLGNGKSCIFLTILIHSPYAL